MLRKFRDMLTPASGDGALQQPPFALRAKDLDKNFELCYPLPTDGPNTPYIIERPSDGGWRLKPTQVFDVCENGQPVKYVFFAQRAPTSGQF